MEIKKALFQDWDTMKKALQAFYLDWVNNYFAVNISTAKMAEDYQLDEKEVKELIDIGRKIHETLVEK